MMNSISQIQNELDRLATMGLSICQAPKLEKTPIVYTIGVNILIAGVGAVAACACPPAVPIILGVTALGLVAYNVYAIYQRVQKERQQKKLAPFETIFSNIRMQEYALAWTQLNNALEHDQNASSGQALLQFRTRFNVLDELLKLGVRDPVNDFYPYLFSYIAFMKARDEYHLAHNKTPELLNRLITFVRHQNSGTRGSFTRSEIEKLFQEANPN